MFLALHGNVGSIHDFSFLSNSEEIKAIDLWALTEMPLAQAAGQLKNLVPGDSSFRGLMAYSMGGRLGLQALAIDPDFWDVAIIVSAHPGLTDEIERAARRERDGCWATMIRNGSWEEFLKEWNGQTVFGGTKPSPYQVELESEKQSIADAFENWSLGCQEDLRPSLQHCRSKVIWVAGQEDQKFMNLGREMKQIIPDCELIEIPNCGHRVLQENPEAVTQLVRQYAVK